MKSRLVLSPAVMLIILMLAIALATIYQLPADSRVVVHWSGDGEPNGWMGKWTGLLFIPLVSAIAWLSMRFATHNHSGSAGRASGTSAPMQFILFIPLIGESLISATALGYVIPPNRTSYFSVGILFLLAGAVFRGLARNTLFGLKTPWTLNREELWKRIHTACCWIFSTCGGGIITAALASSDVVRPGVAVAFILAAPAIALLYSCLAWRGAFR